ncbi:hypothetical protein [Leuconostoc pseudomesenteroides]|uniref:hypothetical protein n=1 Tax=Leuconostoc pseudomesenteroides TaxID=33968 RepID=UPI00166F1388|nr:hypothetical protein [Leuconostoc pseudomesenteroides]
MFRKMNRQLKNEIFKTAKATEIVLGSRKKNMGYEDNTIEAGILNDEEFVNRFIKTYETEIIHARIEIILSQVDVKKLSLCNRLLLAKLKRKLG